MRIARTAATFVLVLTVAGCGAASPTEPAGGSDESPAKTRQTRPSLVSPRFGNGMMGSGA